MKPEGSSPYSQVPATCPYPEPTPSSPTTPSHFPKIHLNIFLPSKPGSPQWSLSLRFPHPNPVHTSPLPHMRYMPRPSHYSSYVRTEKVSTIWLLTATLVVVPHPNLQMLHFLFIQQIYVLNILNILHTLRFFLFKMSFISEYYFFDSCIIHILHTGCDKI